MRRTLLMSVAAMSVLAGMAFAQNGTGGTQSPASPGAASQVPQPANSLPSGATTSVQNAPGSTLGTSVAPSTVFVTPRPAVPVAPVVAAPAPMAVAPAPVFAAPAPMAVAPAPVVAAPAPMQAAPQPPMVTATPAPVVTATPSGVATTRPMKPVARMAVNRRPRPAPLDQSAAPTDVAAPPTEVYRGGAGSPSSSQATNIAPSRPETLGRRLPEPGANSNSPEALLSSALRDINAGRTGAAQEGLERAQTRILSRTTEPSMAGQPDSAAMTMHIAAARQALGSRNLAAARAEVQAALSAPVPPPGPAVTETVTPQPPIVLVPGQPGYGPRTY